MNDFLSTPNNLDTNIKILLVDDHAISLMFIRQILNKINFQNIDEASSGVEAIALFRDNAYDLIVMDCQMPEMDGYETTQKIREISGDKEAPIIIAATATKNDSIQEKCKIAGMNDYINKPVDMAVLISILRRWFCCKDSVRKKENNDQKVQIFDWDHLAEYTDGDKNIEEKFLKTFINNLEKDIAELQLCFDQKDFQGWHEGAHKLCGGCSHIGAKALANICNEGQKTNIENENEIKRIHPLILKEYKIVIEEIGEGELQP